MGRLRDLRRLYVAVFLFAGFSVSLLCHAGEFWGLYHVLEGEDKSEKFDHLGARERSRILEILKATTKVDHK